MLRFIRIREFALIRDLHWALSWERALPRRWFGPEMNRPFWKVYSQCQANLPGVECWLKRELRVKTIRFLFAGKCRRQDAIGFL